MAIKQSTITIKNLSCNRTNWDVEKANCKLPGRPLSPDQGLAALDQLKTAQDGLATALAIPAGGVGDCLGQQRSQLQCLVAVQNLALEIQRRAMQ